MMTYDFGVRFPKEKVEMLKRILTACSDLFDGDPQVVKEVVDAYKLKKPMTCIEIHEGNPDDVVYFTEELATFFFVRRLHIDDGYVVVFVSRFRNLVDVAVYHSGLGDAFADLAGVLYFGRDFHNVAAYCLKERPDLVKVGDGDVVHKDGK